MADILKDHLGIIKMFINLLGFSNGCIVTFAVTNSFDFYVII